MNPKEFNWDESQQVTVINPTKEDFSFKVHSKDYVVHAGETVKMPGFIAWVYVYGIASQMVQADGLFHKWNEEGFRKEYFDKVTVGAEEVIQTVEPEPVLVERVEPPKATAKSTK